MKQQIIVTALLISLFACSQPADQTKALQSRIDSLEQQLANSYKPGFGDIMGSVQTHHAKLWWAGQNENWALGTFEMKELRERIDDILKYETDRPESKLIGMMAPALDSVAAALDARNPAQFKRSYELLTTSCNECHQKTDFGYNVVIIPKNQTFSNQEFRLNPPK